MQQKYKTLYHRILDKCNHRKWILINSGVLYNNEFYPYYRINESFHGRGLSELVRKYATERTI